MRLLLVGCGMWEHPIWRGLKQAVVALRVKGWDVLHLWTTHPPDDIDRQFDKFQPDVVIAIGGGQMMKRFATFDRAMKRHSNAQRGLWFCDLRPPYRTMPGVFDIAFLCWTRHAPWGGLNYEHGVWQNRLKCETRYMPQGADVIKPLNDSVIDTGIRTIFIGSTGESRWHQGRRRLCGRIGARIYNRGGSEARNKLEREMKHLYRTTRYCLSTSPKVPGYTSVRTYRILATRGLLLLHRFPDCERLFKHGQHALIFDDAKDARAMMAKWDHLKDRRVAIMRRGWQLAQAKHTVQRRIENMVANLTGTSDAFWGWHDG